MKTGYTTGLSDVEWECIEPHLGSPNRRGRPKIHSLRRILNAIFYVFLRSGCAWRLLPRDFPPWEGRLLLVQQMARRRDVGAPERRAARAAADPIRQERAPQREHSGLAIGQDHRGRR